VRRERTPATIRLAAAPAISAVLIVALGCLLTARAVPAII